MDAFGSIVEQVAFLLLLAFSGRQAIFDRPYPSVQNNGDKNTQTFQDGFKPVIFLRDEWEVKFTSFQTIPNKHTTNITK